MSRDHGHLDQVRGRALDGGVDGGPLPEAPEVPVLALQFRDLADTTEKGSHIPRLVSLRQSRFRPALDALVTLEVLVDETLGFPPSDLQVPSQAEGADPVEDPEIDDLGVAAPFPGTQIGALPQDLGGRPLVDILSLAECVHQDRILGEVSHDSELDLRIVGRQQPISLFGHEGSPDLPAQIGLDGDVLEVGVAGGEAPRRRHHLVVGGVDPAGTGVDQSGQRVQVGVLQLRLLPVLDDAFGDLVLAGQPLQHLDSGGEVFRLGRLLGGRESQFLEQDRPELLGRVEVELLAGQFGDAVREDLDLLAHLARHGLQHLPVHLHPGGLHVGQHLHQGNLHLEEQILQPVGPDRRLQHAEEPKGQVGRPGQQLLLVREEARFGLAQPGLETLGRQTLQREVVLVGSQQVGHEARIGELGRQLPPPGPSQHEQGLQIVNDPPFGSIQEGEDPVGASLQEIPTQVDPLPLSHRNADAPHRLPFGAGKQRQSGLGAFQPGQEGVQLRAALESLVLASGRLRFGQELLQQSGEIQLQEELPALGRIRFRDPEGLQVQIQRNPVVHGHQFAALPDHGFVLLETLPIGLAPDLVPVGQQIVQIPVAPEQQRGALLADSLRARDVVGGVADQAQEVAQLLRPDSELLLHLGRVESGHGSRIENGHARVHDLEKVLVDGDDDHLQTVFPRLPGDGGDDVVRLVSRVGEHGHPKDPAHPMEVGDLPRQVFRHGWPGRLVVGKLLVPNRGPGKIHGHGQIVRLLFLDQLAQHARESEDGAGGKPLPVGQSPDGIVRPVELGHAVDDVEAWSRHNSSILSADSRSRRVIHPAPGPGGR